VSRRQRCEQANVLIEISLRSGKRMDLANGMSSSNSSKGDCHPATRDPHLSHTVSTRNPYF
jgi:hypothetical protein